MPPRLIVKEEIRDFLAAGEGTRGVRAGPHLIRRACRYESSVLALTLGALGKVEALEDQPLTPNSADEPERGPAEAITQISRFICDLYGLDLCLDGHDFLVSQQLARTLLPDPSPRTGVLAIEDADQLQLGVYIDPDDCENLFALVEETSHLVCLAWHAALDRPVSALVLELQSEIDRFLYFCHDSGDLSFSCFRRGRSAAWLNDRDRERYEAARTRAQRYCRRLAQRFAPRGDTRGLARELRRFYRASPSQKLSV